MKYEALFDEAENEEELIESLGSPTKLAIGLALNYVPSPPPAVMPVEKEEYEETQNEVIPESEESSDDAESAPREEVAQPETPEAEDEPIPQPEPVKRKVRAFGLIVSILFGLVIGIPVALVLICIGIPFLALGLAIVGLCAWAVITVVPMLAMISDILVIVGIGLVICALGLLLAWFGLWASIELGYLWISGVVLRLGRALTYKKEVAVQ